MEKNKRREITAARVIDSPIGKLYIAENGAGLCAVRMFFMLSGSEPITQEKASPLLDETERQLGAYFRGELKEFDLPLAPEGTEFQKKVWNALCEIPYGATDTYGGIAKKTGNPKACRAVGMANNRNPIMIIVPCHRVIGADGSLVGYGCGLDTKRFLLDLERSVERILI